MATVDVQPMPEWVRKLKRFRPLPPPIFTGDGDVTLADRELAIDLWRALDLESRRWYLCGAREFAGIPLTRADMDALRKSGE